MLSKESLRQLKGVKQLLDDAFTAGLDATEKLHQTIARKPYDVLEKIDPIATPVQSIGKVQSGITQGVYAAIRGIHQLGTGLVDKAIDLADREPTKRN